MEYSNISALLEKYWACETNEVEELQLREFYATHEGDLPADLQEAAPLFRYFHAEGEGGAMPELFTDVQAPWDTATVIRPFWQGWMKYAAVLLVGIGMGYAVNQYLQKKDAAAGNRTYAFRDTYNDPELAYQETQKALQILSKNLNKGKTQMEKLSYLSEATDMLQSSHN